MYELGYFRHGPALEYSSAGFGVFSIFFSLANQILLECHTIVFVITLVGVNFLLLKKVAKVVSY